MELLPKQQIVELIKKSESILLISHTKPGGDSVGSLLALQNLLNNLGKRASVVVSETIPPSLSFLPNISDIKKNVDGSNDLVLKVNIENTNIEKISTNTDGKTLDIILTPQNGKLEAENVKIESGKPVYDTIIVLDTPDVDKIDKIYDEHTELFFETPVVNIDHHAGNEYFGTINWVDLTATSTAEILVALFEALGTSKPDEDTATLLLAGITADTASFKNINTTPKTLTVAAQLLAAGARQQEIIQNFYKMKNLKTLKLWGKILSNVQKDTEHRVIWSKVGHDDFGGANATIEEAKEVMDEMLANTPNADVVALLIETDKNMITVLLKGIKGTDVLEIAEIFGGSGHAMATVFEMKNVQLAGAEERVLSEIKKIRAKKLGRPVRESNSAEASLDKEVKPKVSEEKPKKVEEVLREEKQENSESNPASSFAEASLDEKKKSISVESFNGKAVEKTETKVEEDSGDVISKAIESLEAAGENIEADTAEAPTSEGAGVPTESVGKKKIQKDPNSLTHVSEILKKFDPNEKQKLTEFEKKNEEARKNLKKDNGGK